MNKIPLQKVKKRQKGKTIFFLGAGFSMGAGAPSQARLLELIHDFNIQEFIDRYQPEFRGPVDRILEQQLIQVMRFVNKLMAQSPNIDLEDIYTPIDRSIIDGTSFKGYSPDQLRKVREAFNALIGIIIDKSFADGDHGYVHRFAEYLVEENRRTVKGDNAVVFSTNWDIVLDNAIHQLCYKPVGRDVVDYCCHYTNYNHGEQFIPPLIVKERGDHTHKILKLHGSLNWLKCTGCGRIQISLQEKVALRHYYDETNCRFCGTRHMEPEMLMPTFLKQNNNTQLKNVWDQAGIELLEADRIVFLGYSLPMADFEIRQMLSKFLDRKVKVEVVLTRSSDPETYGVIEPDIADKIIYNLASSRYQRFFARNRIQFHYDEVEEYINQLTQ